MCRVLGVSKSGYYESLKKKPAPSHLTVAKAMDEIQKEGRKRYGSRRMRKALRKKYGIRMSRKTVIKRMKSWGLVAYRRKLFKKTTDSNHSLGASPNLLQRNFTAASPNQCWVSDITYVRTNEGWLYLVTFLDLYSRMIVGWSMSEYMDATFVCRAFEMACRNRQTAPRMVHSDRGIQYASADFRNLLRQHPQCVQSMSRKANCWDNAVAESFFATLKQELLTLKFETRQAARLAIFEYIEGFYNVLRLHSALDYQSPIEYELAPRAA